MVRFSKSSLGNLTCRKRLPEPQKYVNIIAFCAIVRGFGLSFFLLFGVQVAQFP